jgi:hypothetical protein
MKEHLFYQGNPLGFTPLAAGTKRYGAEVVFGNPKDHCKGVGICHLVLSRQFNSFLACKNGHRAKCTVAYTAPGHLWLSFAREGLTDYLADLYFSGNYFYNPQLFLIHQYPDLPKGHAPLRVPAGCYPLLEADNRIHIYFRLDG